MCLLQVGKLISKYYLEELSASTAEAVGRRPLSGDARVRSHLSPCEIFDGRSGTGKGFSPSTSVFPFQYPSANALCYSASVCCFTRARGRSMVAFQKSILFRKSGSIG